MSLLAKQTGGDSNFEKPPEGNHLAVCFGVVDLGMQESNYQGIVSMKRKIRISWELPQELMSEGEFAGQPFSISKNYTLSLHEKAVLYKDLISWRGRSFTSSELEGFDVFNVLGASCMLNIIHQKSDDGSRVYANVSSIAQLPKGMQKMSPCNDLRKFDTESYTPEEYESLPEWLRAKININPVEPQIPDNINNNSFDDDIPFS